MKRLPSARFWGLLCLVEARELFAQTYQGGIHGSVPDSNQGVIPGAAVTLTKETTNLGRETTTNDRGEYAFPSLAPGTYRLGRTERFHQVHQFHRPDPRGTRKTTSVRARDGELGADRRRPFTHPDQSPMYGRRRLRWIESPTVITHAQLSGRVTAGDRHCLATGVFGARSSSPRS